MKLSSAAGFYAQQLDDIYKVIEALDNLPADHDPDKQVLWEAIRVIEDICEQTP